MNWKFPLISIYKIRKYIGQYSIALIQLWAVNKNRWKRMTFPLALRSLNKLVRIAWTIAVSMGIFILVQIARYRKDHGDKQILNLLNKRINSNRQFHGMAINQNLDIMSWIKIRFKGNNKIVLSKDHLGKVCKISAVINFKRYKQISNLSNKKTNSNRQFHWMWINQHLDIILQIKIRFKVNYTIGHGYLEQI